MDTNPASVLSDTTVMVWCEYDNLLNLSGLLHIYFMTTMFYL